MRRYRHVLIKYKKGESLKIVEEGVGMRVESWKEK